MILNKKLSMVCISFILGMTSLNAKYIQIHDQEAKIYNFEVLNYDIFLEKDNMTVGEILSKIEGTTNYRVFDEIQIPSDKIISDSSKYKSIGGVLNRILKEYNGIPYSDKFIIHLDHYQTESLTLPYGWDVENTAEKLKNAFPEVDFFIEGFKIKAFGDKLTISKVKEKYFYLDKLANQKLNFNLEIYPYKNNNKDLKKLYIGKRTSLVEKKEDVIQDLKIKIGHNEEILVSLENNIYSFKFDLQNQEIVLDKINNNVKNNYKDEAKIKLPIEYFGKAGLVVPTKNTSLFKGENSFMFVFKINEGFINK